MVGSAYLGQVIGSVGRGVIRVAGIGRVRVGVAVCGVSDGRSGVCTVSDRGRVSRAQQQPSLVPSRFRRDGLGLWRFDGLYLGGFRLRESRGGHQGEKSDNLRIGKKNISRHVYTMYRKVSSIYVLQRNLQRRKTFVFSKFLIFLLRCWENMRKNKAIFLIFLLSSYILFLLSFTRYNWLSSLLLYLDLILLK